MTVNSIELIVAPRHSRRFSKNKKTIHNTIVRINNNMNLEMLDTIREALWVPGQDHVFYQECFHHINEALKTIVCHSPLCGKCVSFHPTDHASVGYVSCGNPDHDRAIVELKKYLRPVFNCCLLYVEKKKHLLHYFAYQHLLMSNPSTIDEIHHHIFPVEGHVSSITTFRDCENFVFDRPLDAMERMDIIPQKTFKKQSVITSCVAPVPVIFIKDEEDGTTVAYDNPSNSHDSVELHDCLMTLQHEVEAPDNISISDFTSVASTVVPEPEPNYEEIVADEEENMTIAELCHRNRVRD